MNAEERRFEAIRHLVESEYPVRYDAEHVETYTAMVTLRRKTDIAASILGLLALGRTDRWKNAVTRWAYMVEGSTSTNDLRWAILQGSIYAGHGALRK